MKTNLKWIVFTSIIALVSVTNCKQQTAEEPKKPTVEELGQMNRDFAQALVDGDAEAAANQYDENVSLLPPNEPIVTGREKH